MAQLSQHLLNEYVPQAREYLVKAARSDARRLVRYAEIMNGLGGRGYVGQVLDELNRQEHAKDHPLLSAIVINHSGMPGGEFFTCAKSLARFDGSNHRAFWEAERDAVWRFPWSN